MKEAI